MIFTEINSKHYCTEREINSANETEGNTKDSNKYNNKCVII